MGTKYTSKKAKTQSGSVKTRQDKAASPSVSHAVDPSAVNLADEMVGLLGYAQPMVDVMFDQIGLLELTQGAEQRARISGGVLAMLDSLSRYLTDMRVLCEKVREGDQ